MGGGKNKGEKKEERNKNILIIATVARKTDLPPNSSVWIELQMSSTLPIFDIPRPPSLRIIIDCQSILFQLYFLSLLPSLSFIPFQILFTSFSFRCWQIRDFFFLFSSPRACFLYSTISLELVLSTVNILPLSLHFLFPELFPPPPPPPRVVFYYRWIPPPSPRSLPVIPPGNPFPSCSATNVKIFQSLNFIAIPTPFQGAHITEEEKLLREWYITSGDPTTWSLLARWSDSRHYEWFLTKVDRPPYVIEKYLREKRKSIREHSSSVFRFYSSVIKKQRK